MSYDIDSILAQADQVEKQEKERKPSYTPGPLYDIQIPKWGQSKQFKYQISGDDIAGKKMLAVIVNSQNSYMRWGHKDHDIKKGPMCRVRGYHDPTTGEVVHKSHWEIPRPSVDMTLSAYKPFGSRKDEVTGDFLSCQDCRAKGMDKSEIPNKFGGVDKCEPDAYLEVVVFRHMVETDEGNLYKTVNQTQVGSAYLAKLPITSMTQTAFMNFVFDLARGRRMNYQDVLVEIKIEEEKIKSGAMVAKLDFREMDPEKDSHKAAVLEAQKLYTSKLAEAQAKYAEKRGQKENPVTQTSGGDVPFATGKSY